MNPDSRHLLMGLLLLIWLVMALAFHLLSKRAAPRSKQQLYLLGLIINAALGLAYLYLISLDAIMFWSGAGFVAIMSCVVYSLSRFCSRCGAACSRWGLLGTPHYCAACGAKLDEVAGRRDDK